MKIFFPAFFILFVINISTSLHSSDNNNPSGIKPAESFPAGIWKSRDDKGNTIALWKITNVNNILSAAVISLPGYREDIKSKDCSGVFKEKPVVGTAWIYDLKQYSGRLYKGYYTDPATGKLYHCEVDLSGFKRGNESIKINVFRYFSLFGRHQIWERSQENLISKFNGPSVSSGSVMPALSGSEKGTLVLKDFSDNEKFFNYSGPKSKIKINRITDPYNKKNRVLTIYSITKDYSGVEFIFPSKYGYWDNYLNLRLRIFGNNSKKPFIFGLGDVDYEQFAYYITDDWEGWKDIVIPINKFVRRKDYQPGNILLNNHIDYPVLSIYFLFIKESGDLNLMIGKILLSDYVERNSLRLL